MLYSLKTRKRKSKTVVGFKTDSGDYHCLLIGGKMIKKIKKQSYIGCALRIAVEITVLMLLLTSDASAISNSNGGNWLYFKDVTISNSGSPLSDYQVQVNLTGDNFPLYANSSGEDIRFTDASGNELNYWIESWNNSSKTASIWVKVPSILTGSPTHIKMYYGNPMAISSSNGDKTFEFFDDFSGNLSKWTILQGGTAVIENEELSIMDTSSTKDFIHSKTFQTKNGIIEAKIKVLSTAFVAHWIIDGRWTSPYTYISVTARLGSGYNDFYTFVGYPIKSIPWATNTLNTWFLFQLKMNEDKIEGNAYDMSGALLKSAQGSSTTGIGYVDIRSWGSSHTHYDDIRVRKYASPDPSVSVGSETSNIRENFTIAHITDVHIGYYINFSGMRESVKRFTDTLQAIKKAQPNSILITGDLVEYDKKDYFLAFKNILKSNKIPVNITPGNHDRRGEIFSMSDYNTYIQPLNNPTNSYGDDYFFDFKGYRFIGLDSGADYSIFIDNNGIIDISPEATGLTDFQMGLLRKEFNNSAPKIVFMHNPVMSFENDAIYRDPILGNILVGVPPDGGPGYNDGAIAFNRWNFINYTIDSNVQLVLTGHSHANATFDLAGNSATNNSPNRPLFIQTQNKGYRIIEVKNGKANPYDSEPLPRFERTSGEWVLKNIQLNINSVLLGLHAYDSLKRHTGMIACSNDFELGIPDSYYTGNYGGNSLTPEVIVGYSNDTKIKTEITEFKIFSIFCVPKVSNMAKSAMNMQTSTSENLAFNLSIEKQKKTFTTEMGFHDINVTESSIATVNVSDEVKNYKMDLDLDGDGTIDRIIYPDSIDTILAQPQNTIDVIAYNGAGTINLASSSGYFIKAASLNASLINGGPIYDFPYGLLAFNISGLGSGQTINVTITLPQNLSQNARYWNYGATSDIQTPHWYRIPIASNNGDNVISIQMQDGGFGDDDLNANGIITSAGGPGIPLVGKVTGGGWIRNQSVQVSKNNNKDDKDSKGDKDNKATFAFEARFVNGTPHGNLEYTDHAGGMKLHGDVTTLRVNKETATFGGIAKINGTGGYAYTVTAVDKGESGKNDTFTINIPSIAYLANGTLGGGNIEIHDEESQDTPNFDRDNSEGNIKIHDKD